MNAIRYRLAWTTALGLLAVLIASAARGETVIARKRLGNNVEAMTYDPVNDRAVVMDGDDVIGVALNPLDEPVLATQRNPTNGIEGRGFRKLFDVLALPVEGRQPKGIGYVPNLHRYYFTSDEPGGTGTFYSTDEEGHPRPPLVLRGLSRPVDAWEGLSWIPPGAPSHGGTLAALGYRNDEGVSHLYYVRLDGTVEAEIVPEPGTALETYFCGVSYWPDHPATLLLSDCFSGVFSMDGRTGAQVGDPTRPIVPISETSGAEGIIVRRNGNVLLSGYEEARLFAYDRGFNRTPGDDRLFSIGIGRSTRWITWDFDTGEFIALSPGSSHVFGISRDLRTARRLFDVPVTHEVPNPVGISYLGGNQLGLANGGFPRGIDVVQMVSDRYEVPNGTSISRWIWDSDAFPPGPSFNPRGFGALGPNAWVFKARGDASALKVVTRSGTSDTSVYADGIIPVRLTDIVLSEPTQGVAAQVFDDGSGPRIFTGAEIYGLDGKLVHRIDQTRLGLAHPLSNGVWLGGNTFATVDGLTSTVVVYTVP